MPQAMTKITSEFKCLSFAQGEFMEVHSEGLG